MMISRHNCDADGEIQATSGSAYLTISNEPATVRKLADRVELIDYNKGILYSVILNADEVRAAYTALFGDPNDPKIIQLPRRG